MHRQMADMMKLMGKQRGGLMQRMMGKGGGAAPSPAELEKMQAELARLDPKALEKLPKDLRGRFAQGAAGIAAAGPMPKLPGLPGLGGGMPRLPGLPGLPGKKK